MVIWAVVIKAYTIMTFLTVGDEIWNIKNPRPYPKTKYAIVNWEVKDFILLKDGSYLLRKKRKVDNKTKAEARRIWHEHKTKRIR